MNKKDKYLKITKKTAVRYLDPDLNIKLDILSIKDILKIKILSSLKFFYSVLVIILNLKKYLNFLKLKNTKKNKKLFILGGGPSIKKIINTKKYKLKKNIDFMAISYFKDYGNINIKPDYILSGDNVFLRKSKDKFINSKNKKIFNYLKKNKIKLFLPIEGSASFKKTDFDITYFISRTSILFFKNTNPIMNLSVSNMSFFYALSIGLFMGYKKIYFLGLDNTYPKDVWVNKENKLFNVERYANKFFLSDQTKRYKSISDMYAEISLIFYSLNLYKKYKDRIFNLDEFSLTNTFIKRKLRDIFIIS